MSYFLHFMLYAHLVFNDNKKMANTRIKETSILLNQP